MVPEQIVYAPPGSFSEQMAANEIRRYLYLRTGQLLSIRDQQNSTAIVIAGPESSLPPKRRNL